MATNQFETWQVILIIVIVLGVIWSNIAVLKYLNRFDIKTKVDKITNKEVDKKENAKHHHK
jgi:hypothetical protein